MNTLTALRLDRDRELSGDIVPEAYFRCVAVRELAYPWAARDFERQLTEVRSAWTDKFLYLHLWAKDSWITAEDRLSVFLSRVDGSYRVWECTALGVLDSYEVQGRNTDRSWKTAAQSKVRRHDAGWVWELRIPFAKDLGEPPRRGEAWRAAFNRADADRRGRISLSTSSELASDTDANFHQPDGFGQLVYS